MPSELRQALLANGRPATIRRCCVVKWEWIFFANVFMACVSFSVVMPSLWLYLSSLGATQTFYATVVASYSIGEAIGSVTLGALSNFCSTKTTLACCALISLSGALSYALADFVFVAISPNAAPAVVLAARLLQGIGSGGQACTNSLLQKQPRVPQTPILSHLSDKEPTIFPWHFPVPPSRATFPCHFPVCDTAISSPPHPNPTPPHPAPQL